MSGHMIARRLLLIEDDPELRTLLRRLLGEEGYTVTQAVEGREGLRELLTGAYDIVVLDRGLPLVDGLDVLASARAHHIDVPVLILSARGTAQDRVQGLTAGAEDYLVKPFAVGELLARLTALLRRQVAATRWQTIGTLRLDKTDRTVTDSDTGAVVAVLSAREFALLSVLAASPGKLFDRTELRELVFTDADSDAAVDTYVHYCRRKLGDAVIVTVRGYGYRIGSA